MQKLLLGASALLLAQTRSIIDFGAEVGRAENTTRAFINSRAMYQAIIAANQSSDDRTVLIPKGSQFIMMPVYPTNVHNITFQVDGEVYAS